MLLILLTSILVEDFHQVEDLFGKEFDEEADPFAEDAFNQIDEEEENTQSESSSSATETSSTTTAETSSTDTPWPTQKPLPLPTNSPIPLPITNIFCLYSTDSTGCPSDVQEKIEITGLDDRLTKVISDGSAPKSLKIYAAGNGKVSMKLASKFNDFHVEIIGTTGNAIHFDLSFNGNALSNFKAENSDINFLSNMKTTVDFSLNKMIKVVGNTIESPTIYSDTHSIIGLVELKGDLFTVLNGTKAKTTEGVPKFNVKTIRFGIDVQHILVGLGYYQLSECKIQFVSGLYEFEAVVSSQLNIEFSSSGIAYRNMMAVHSYPNIHVYCSNKAKIVMIGKYSATTGNPIKLASLNGGKTKLICNTTSIDGKSKLPIEAVPNSSFIIGGTSIEHILLDNFAQSSLSIDTEAGTISRIIFQDNNFKIVTPTKNITIDVNIAKLNLSLYNSNLLFPLVVSSLQGYSGKTVPFIFASGSKVVFDDSMENSTIIISNEASKNSSVVVPPNVKVQDEKGNSVNVHEYSIQDPSNLVTPEIDEGLSGGAVACIVIACIIFIAILVAVVLYMTPVGTYFGIDTVGPWGGKADNEETNSGLDDI